MVIPRWLTDLAERKLGNGAIVKMVDGLWAAEIVTRSGHTRISAKTRDILVWLLEQTPNIVDDTPTFGVPPEGEV